MLFGLRARAPRPSALRLKGAPNVDMNLTCAPSNTNSLSVSLRECFLFIAILWGVSVTIITEILSAFSLITFGWLVVFWCVVLLGATCFVITLMKRQRLIVLSPSLRLPFRAVPFLSGLVLIVALTGVTAFVSPPNNYDSMTYHMSRVVHWIQDRNVSFYPTHVIRQLYMNPWAEFAIMHLQILSGGDRFANFVQWFSMIGCLIGVSLLAKQFGGDLQSQLFAAVFAGTIPMGILQSSSTQNDYAVSFWLVCFIYFSISLIRQGQLHWFYALGAGFSLGLVILTKGTAYIFAVPFVVWIGYSLLRTFRFQSWKPAILLVAACLVLNSGHYARNLSLFGSPIGPRGPDSIARVTSDVISPSSVLSNITRNIALHLGTPSLRINIAIDSAIQELHRVLNIDINDPRTTEPNRKFQVLQPSLHEDSAGNLLHLSLILGAIFLFFISKEIRSSCALASYLTALFSGFLLFCALLKWQPWHSRLQLPFFVLASPFVAAVLFKRLNKKFTIVIAFALLLSALPWVVFNSSRPLMGDQNILNRTRLDQYFNNRSDLRDLFLGAAYFLKSNKCGQVGLDIGTNDWEYPFWPLLNPEANVAIRIEHVHVKNQSGLISVLPHFSGFSPCAIISSRAGRVEELTTETGAYTKEWASGLISVFVRKAPPQVP
jgi:hypothetical protein